MDWMCGHSNLLNACYVDILSRLFLRAGRTDLHQIWVGHDIKVVNIRLVFTEFTDASSDTVLAWVGTGFHHITPTISNTQHYIITVPSLSHVRCIFLKVLIELQLILHCDSTFQWSTTLLMKTNFLTSSLNLFLNSFILWPLLPLSSSLKNISLLSKWSK